MANSEEFYPTHSRPFVVSVSETVVKDYLVHAFDEDAAMVKVEETNDCEELAEELVEFKVEGCHALEETAWSQDYEVVERDFKYADPFGDV